MSRRTPQAPRHPRIPRSLLAAVLLLGACAQPPGEELARREAAIGDPDRGLRLIREYGCHACHIVPGIRDREGLVGPPLIHWSRRTILAGSVHNNPDNVARFIHSPESLSPGTAMPDVGASLEEAAHMAAYLFTLR
jgi:cytochrome c